MAPDIRAQRITKSRKNKFVHESSDLARVTMSGTLRTQIWWSLEKGIAAREKSVKFISFSE
jgi:hypothetical protein